MTRNIVENAIAGTHAGGPVVANNPDERTLTYSLSGRCSNWFQVHPNGQIVLGAGQTLDVDEQEEFHLTLHVSDGVDASGNADTSADDSEPVTIKVIGTPDGTADHPAVTFSLRNPYPGEQPNRDLSGTPPVSVPMHYVVDIIPPLQQPALGPYRLPLGGFRCW